MHDPAEHERFVSELIEAFAPSSFSRLASAGHRDPAARIHRRDATVRNHSDRADLGQPFPVPRGRRATAGPARLSGDPRHLLDSDGTPGLVHRRSDRRSRPPTGRMARRANCNRWTAETRRGFGDKMPDNYMHLGLLASCFPMPFSFTAAATCATWPFRAGSPAFGTVRWTNETRHIASRFQQYDRLMKHWQPFLPGVDSPRRLRGNSRQTSRGSPGGSWQRADWSGSRLASNFTE